MNKSYVRTARTHCPGDRTSRDNFICRTDFNSVRKASRLAEGISHPCAGWQNFESFSETGIELTEEQIDHAVTLSDRIIDPQRQWQTYLNSLALFGFETWLQERDNSLIINSDRCSVMQPSMASYIDGVFNLTVGEYKICLLTNGVAVDEFISVDRAIVDLAENVAHFYILINVIEEQGEASIDSFIRYDDLVRQQQAANLSPDADWAYEIPLAWFNPQVDDVLLYLRCLESSAIALPTPSPTADNIESQIESFIPQLRSGQALSEVLTWSQAAPILSNPDLLNWLYELQTTQPSVRDSLAALGDRLNNTIAEVTQTAINVRSWLSDELDGLAQNLSWTLFPSLELAPSGLRDLEAVDRQDPAREIVAIVSQLRESGEEIPADAHGACQDFDLGNYRLRLFAIIWQEETDGVAEWSLLTVLGAQVNSYLPQGLKLELKEGDELLDEKIVLEDTEDSYIYTQIIGDLSEQFTVSVVLANGDRFIFPDFAFN
ncbi:MAG: DUF1822 family protein [Cyanobacteria bacterium P01_G01_bin.19]